MGKDYTVLSKDIVKYVGTEKILFQYFIVQQDYVLK